MRIDVKVNVVIYEEVITGMEEFKRVKREIKMTAKSAYALDTAGNIQETVIGEVGVNNVLHTLFPYVSDQHYKFINGIDGVIIVNTEGRTQEFTMACAGDNKQDLANLQAAVKHINSHISEVQPTSNNAVKFRRGNGWAFN